jgi:hypothetical protein
MARKSEYDKLVSDISKRLEEMGRATSVSEAIANDLTISRAFGIMPGNAEDYDNCPLCGYVRRKKELHDLSRGDAMSSNVRLNAGYVAHSGKRTVYKAQEAGIDASHKYVAVCEEHNQMISAVTQRGAITAMQSSSDWCSGCAERASA